MNIYNRDTDNVMNKLLAERDCIFLFIDESNKTVQVNYTTGIALIYLSTAMIDLQRGVYSKGGNDVIQQCYNRGTLEVRLQGVYTKELDDNINAYVTVEDKREIMRHYIIELKCNAIEDKYVTEGYKVVHSSNRLNPAMTLVPGRIKNRKFLAPQVKLSTSVNTNFFVQKVFFSNGEAQKYIDEHKDNMIQVIYDTQGNHCKYQPDKTTNQLVKEQIVKERLARYGV